MRNRVIFIALIATVSVLMFSYNGVATQKTYTYAWELPITTEYGDIIKSPVKDSQTFLLYWHSPWPVTAYEKKRILKSFSLSKHSTINLNQGYQIRVVDKELLKNGTIKTGLIKVQGDKLKI